MDFFQNNVRKLYIIVCMHLSFQDDLEKKNPLFRLMSLEFPDVARQVTRALGLRDLKLPRKVVSSEAQVTNPRDGRPQGTWKGGVN